MPENKKQFKMAMLAYLSSSVVSIGDLRSYGRVIGVDKPTTKKKSELMEEITQILLGELSPVMQSRKGAPVKNDYVKPTVLNHINKLCADYHIFDKYDAPTPEPNLFGRLMPKKIDPTTLVFEDPNAAEWEKDTIYSGQLDTLNGLHYLLPLNGKNGRKILISDKMIAENELFDGDVVNCFAVQGQTTLVATEVLTVNGLVTKSFTRTYFDECIPCYPETPVAFADKIEKNATLKYFDWVFPIRKGQRACIISPPKAGKSQMLYDLAVAAKKNNPKTLVYVLLVGQSPESVGKFRRAFDVDKLIYTTYEDDAERQVFTAEFILRRLKRFVEHERDVILFVDSLSALARAFNETDASSGGKILAGGLESKTLQYVKRFLATARNMENGGSLTIVGSVSSNTGNPADELISSEIVSVSNLEVQLSEALATKRVYPAIDILKTKQGEGILTTPTDTLVRGKYLPKFGEEAFLRALMDNDTQEDFLNALKNNV